MRRILWAVCLMGWTGFAVHADLPEGQILGNQLRFSFTPAGAGARAAGMANAFIAVADDGTAASWNPAGLAQLREPEFSLVGSYNRKILSQSGLASSDGRDTYSPFQMAYSSDSVDFVSAAIPLDNFSKPVTVQVSWQRIYNLNFHGQPTVLETARTPGGVERFSITQDTDLSGGIGVYSLSGAIRLTKRTILGASLNYWKGDWSTGALISERRIAGGPPLYQDLSYQQRNNISGRNYTLGLLLTYPTFNVGLVYHSPFYADYHYTTAVNANIPSPLLGSAEEDTELRFPKSLGLGVAWHPSDLWTVALDLTYNEWKGMTIQGVPGEYPDLNFFDFRPSGQTSTRNTLSVNAGAEYLVVRDKYVVPIRFGLAYEPQGGMDPVVRSPVNYWVLAAGTGYNTNAFKLDLSVQYRRADYRSGAYMEPEGMLSVPRLPDAYGNVKAEEWRINLSAIYRVTKSEGLGKILNAVFVGD